MVNLFTCFKHKHFLLYRSSKGDLRWRVSDLDVYEEDVQKFKNLPCCRLKDGEKECLTRIFCAGDEIYHLLRHHIGISADDIFYNRNIKGFLDK